MKKKKLYQIITILVLIIIFSMTLTSCKEWFGQKEPYEDAAEEEAIAEEEEKLIPNEQITYSTSMDGAAVILIVNFKTTEVTGSIS